MRYYYPELKTTAKKEILDLPIEVMKFDKRTYKALTYLSKTGSGGVAKQKFETIGDLINFGKNNMWKMFGNYLSYDETCVVFANIEERLAKVGVKLKDSEFDVGSSRPSSLDVSDRAKQYMNKAGFRTLDDLVINYSKLIRSLPGDRAAIVKDIAEALQQVGMKFDRKKFILDQSKVFDATKYLEDAEKFRKNPELYRNNYLEKVVQTSESTLKTKKVDMRGLNKDEILAMPVTNFGLTKKFKETFYSLGIYTIGDLVKQTRSAIKQNFSQYQTTRIIEELEKLDLSLAKEPSKVKIGNALYRDAVYDAEMQEYEDELTDREKKEFINKPISSPLFPPRAVEAVNKSGKYHKIEDLLKAPTETLVMDLGEDAVKMIKLVVGCYGFELGDRKVIKERNTNAKLYETALTLPDEEKKKMLDRPLRELGVGMLILRALETIPTKVETISDFSKISSSQLRVVTTTNQYNIVKKLMNAYNIRFQKSTNLNANEDPKERNYHKALYEKTLSATEEEKKELRNRPLEELGIGKLIINAISGITPRIKTISDFSQVKKKRVKQATSLNQYKLITALMKAFGIEFQKEYKLSDLIIKDEKPEIKLYNDMTSEEKEKLKSSPLSAVGLKYHHIQYLNKVGILTVGQLMETPQSIVRKAFGNDFAYYRSCKRKLNEYGIELKLQTEETGRGSLQQESALSKVYNGKIQLLDVSLFPEEMKKMQLKDLGFEQFTYRRLNVHRIWTLEELLSLSKKEIRGFFKNNYNQTNKVYTRLAELYNELSKETKEESKMQDDEETKIKQTAIEALGLSDRSVKYLKESGVNTLGDLVKHTRTEVRLILKSFNKATNECFKAVTDRGLDFVNRRKNQKKARGSKKVIITNELSELGLAQNVVYKLSAVGVDTIEKLSKLTKMQAREAVKYYKPSYKVLKAFMEEKGIKFKAATPLDKLLENGEIKNELSAIGLPQRAVYNLKQNGIETIAEIKQLTKTEFNKIIKQTGKLLKECGDVLRRQGITFYGEKHSTRVNAEDRLRYISEYGLDNEILTLGISLNSVKLLKDKGIENFEALTKLTKTQARKVLKINDDAYKKLYSAMQTRGLEFSVVIPANSEKEKGIEIDNELSRLGVLPLATYRLKEAGVESLAGLTQLCATDLVEIFKGNHKYTQNVKEILTANGLKLTDKRDKGIGKQKELEKEKTKQQKEIELRNLGIFDSELYKLGFPVVAVVNFKNAGIETIEQLGKITKSEARKILKCNPKRYDEVFECLTKNGLSYRKVLNDNKAISSENIEDLGIKDNELYKLGLRVDAVLDLKDAGVQTLAGLVGLTRTQARQILKGNKNRLEAVGSLLENQGLTYKQPAKKNLKGYFKKGEIVENELTRIGVNLSAARKLKAAGIETIDGLKSKTRTQVREIVCYYTPSFKNIEEVLAKNGLEFATPNIAKAQEDARQAKREKEDAAVLAQDLSEDLRKMIAMGFPIKSIGFLNNAGVKTIDEFRTLKKVELRKVLKTNKLFDEVIAVAKENNIQFIKSYKGKKVKVSAINAYLKENAEIKEPVDKSNEEKIEIMKSDISHLDLPDEVIGLLREKKVFNVYELMNYTEAEINDMFPDNAKIRKVVKIALYKEGLTFKTLVKCGRANKKTENTADNVVKRSRNEAMHFSKSRVEVVDYGKLSIDDREKFRSIELSVFGVPQKLVDKLKRARITTIWDLVTTQKSKIATAVANQKYVEKLEDVANTYGLQLNGSRSSFSRVKKPTTFSTPRLFIFGERVVEEQKNEPKVNKMDALRASAARAIEEKRVQPIEIIKELPQETNEVIQEQVNEKLEQNVNSLSVLKDEIAIKGLDVLYDLPDKYFVENSKELDELRVFMIEWFLDRVDVMILGAGSEEVMDRSMLHISRQKETFEKIIEERLIKVAPKNDMEEKRNNAAAAIRGKIMNSMGKFHHKDFPKQNNNDVKHFSEEINLD